MASRRVATAIGNRSGEAGGPPVAPTTAESKRIAGLVGPTLIALSASEALNDRIWDDNLAPLTYLDGALLFVGGLSIVRASALSPESASSFGETDAGHGAAPNRSYQGESPLLDSPECGCAG